MTYYMRTRAIYSKEIATGEKAARNWDHQVAGFTILDVDPNVSPWASGLRGLSLEASQRGKTERPTLL